VEEAVCLPFVAVNSLLVVLCAWFFGFCWVSDAD
jgi:hypothetical protein